MLNMIVVSMKHVAMIGWFGKAKLAKETEVEFATVTYESLLEVRNLLTNKKIRS